MDEFKITATIIDRKNSLFDEYVERLRRVGICFRHDQDTISCSELCDAIEAKINEAKKEILDKVLGKGYQWDIAKDI